MAEPKQSTAQSQASREVRKDEKVGTGMIALLRGHSELFTEGFLVPVTVSAGAAMLRAMLRAGAVRLRRLDRRDRPAAGPQP